MIILAYLLIHVLNNFFTAVAEEYLQQIFSPCAFKPSCKLGSPGRHFFQYWGLAPLPYKSESLGGRGWVGAQALTFLNSTPDDSFDHAYHQIIDSLNAPDTCQAHSYLCTLAHIIPPPTPTLIWKPSPSHIHFYSSSKTSLDTLSSIRTLLFPHTLLFDDSLLPTGVRDSSPTDI